MGTRMIAVLVTIAFSVIGVLGDYFLKLASAREQSLRTSWFYLGFALYASTAFGWVFVMKHLKLATISVLYSVSLVLLLTAIGVVLFRESFFFLGRRRHMRCYRDWSSDVCSSDLDADRVLATRYRSELRAQVVHRRERRH